jgi:PEP-CTERM motif-containing protein
MRTIGRIAVVVFVGCCGVAAAQSPGVLYTWNGTGNVQDWVSTDLSSPEGAINLTTSDNNTAGQLTVTEMGDTIFHDPGGTIFIHDGFNRIREKNLATGLADNASGALDVTGLNSIDVDLERNGTGNIQVQLYVQATPAFSFITFPSSFYTIGPGASTLSFPVNLLTPDQQTYIRGFGLKVFDHVAAGNITWSIKEVRSAGTPLTTRVLATHDPGSSDNGLNGVLANFDQAAILGNDGGQNQSGMTVNANGSLQWTDKGGSSGAAIGYGNGTEWSSNTFNERPTDASNYKHVTFRMSATDASNPTGSVGVQGYLQTGNAFSFLSNGAALLPTDGQFHDITFPLYMLTDRQNTMLTGINLFAHPTDLVINIDKVTFDSFAIPGDYDNNGIVDASDEAVWRDNLGKAIALPNEGASPNIVDQDDFTFWKSHFNWVTPTGSSINGGGVAGSTTVPEPATLLLGFIATCGIWWLRRRG